jgi:hypothetical protein
MDDPRTERVQRPLANVTVAFGALVRSPCLGGKPGVVGLGDELGVGMSGCLVDQVVHRILLLLLVVSRLMGITSACAETC